MPYGVKLLDTLGRLCELIQYEFNIVGLHKDLKARFTAIFA
jgi:hypothetical protein